MEYDSESSCEDRLKDLESSGEPLPLRQAQNTDKLLKICSSIPWHSTPVAPAQSKLNVNATCKSLSSQVIEYYQKYSQNSNLDQYFSLPTSSTTPGAGKYYYSIYELNPKLDKNRQNCVGEEYNLKSYVPRERRRWIRPPLIGQSSSTENTSRYVQPLTNPQSVSPDLKNNTSDTLSEEKSDNQKLNIDSTERRISSPTSSIASLKPLEWDSGADVGYFNTLPHNKQNSKKLSTIERMALTGGCSAALRLDPEGTTESGVPNKVNVIQKHPKTLVDPNANSTPIPENISGSESEIEITPIVKNHLPGIITGNDIKSEEKCISKENIKMQETVDQSSQNNNNNNINNNNNNNSNSSINKTNNRISETPKSSLNFKVLITKYPTEGRKIVSKNNEDSQNLNPFNSPLKKSTSMNLIPAFSKLSLKRSQSDLNLQVKDKSKILTPLIFNSSSSIATIVNKPATCDKVIQTSINTCQESIGVQVSVTEEEKPPLPKRGTSLQKTLHSILKNPKGTYKVQCLKQPSSTCEISKTLDKEENEERRKHQTSPEVSQRESVVTPQPDDLENITGRANSFEYFPGHVYENVSNNNSSHVSSVDTGRSNSTIPNTSSSIDEKLWGDSDSLMRDLEKSVNILKSLVDANKCDKHVKKRLIHHVVKRLVSAKYTDDRIEHNLEDNVPWNPDNARNKVYRTEILQALTKKHSSTDSSDDWKPRKQNDCIKKSVQNDRNREMIEEAVLESSNSDKFDRHTDHTEMDGRKARMGLRNDDCQHNINSPTEAEKSESSECFFPQRSQKTNKAKSIFCLKNKCKLPHEESTTTNSTPPDPNRILLDSVVSSRRTPIQSNSEWQLPAALSERQFVLKHCSNSESGDSKLVNYAEMEKKNQLIWITNEISHLCNLKKLLEQPRKLEKLKISPRKSKQTNFKHKPFTALPCTQEQIGDTHYLQRISPNIPKHQMNGQWSSHCNLTTCQQVNESQNILKHLRNSFSQTATDVIKARSNTGSEIVSAAKKRHGLTKLNHIGTQTCSSDISSNSGLAETEIVHFIKCPIHKKLSNHDSECDYQCIVHRTDCPQKVCVQCPTHQNHLQISSCKFCSCATNKHHFNKSTQISSNTQSTSLNSEAIMGTDSSGATSNQFKQKETKNQINASKTKYICECNNVHSCHYNEDHLSETNSIEHTRKEFKKLSKMCQLCSKEVVTIEANDISYKHNRRQSPVSSCKRNTHICPNNDEDKLVYCTCRNTIGISENENINKVERKSTMIKPNGKSNSNGCISKNNAHKEVITLCGSSDECSCENRNETENQTNKHVCECLTDNKQSNELGDTGESPSLQRPYYLTTEKETNHFRYSKVQDSVKPACSNDCLCANQVNDTERKSHSIHYGARKNANGINFSDESSRKSCYTCGKTYQSTKNCKCHYIIPKPVAYELSFTKEDLQRNNDAPSTNILQRSSVSNFPNTVKSETCACEKTKVNYVNKNSNKINTLQDYLTKNKPEFVDNAETRRQYMYEISHLRELRKEKRVQLLAMASIPGAPKLTKSYKLPANTQRKITDQEMKERLRRRYFKLNEVRHKKRQQEKQEEARRNKLMAKIFCKKLQQKVLRGQVDLSQSISVISNL